MNALISSIIDKKKIILENEGRLLKKSFFGLFILSLSFQSGAFGDVVRKSMIDAYIQVSVFVGFTLIVFIVTIWSVLVMAHIFSRAISKTPSVGLGLTLVYVLINFFISSSIS